MRFYLAVLLLLLSFGPQCSADDQPGQSPPISSFEGHILEHKYAAKKFPKDSIVLQTDASAYVLVSNGKIHKLDDVGCKTAKRMFDESTEKQKSDAPVILKAVVHGDELWVLAIRDKRNSVTYQFPNEKTEMSPSRSK